VTRPPADMPPPTPVPAPPRRAFSGLTWKKALVIYFGGVALFLSGCAGLFFSLDQNQGQPREALLTLVIAVCGVGALMAVVGAILILIRFVLFLLGHDKRSA